MREKTHFRSCVISLLVPVAYALIFLLSGAIALALDESEGTYTAFIGIASFMLVLMPLVLLICGIVGNVHGSLALRDREPKRRSILVLSLSVVYTLSAVAIAVALWIGLSKALLSA